MLRLPRTDTDSGAMSFLPKTLLTVVVLGLGAAATHAAPLRVLYFTKSSGFEHSVIKQVDGQPSYSEKIFSRIGPANGIEFTFSKDGGKFTPEYLANFDVVVFYTSGDLSSIGTDGHPAITLVGQRALFDFVRGGKGFFGIHSCSDTFHTGECGGGNNPKRMQRYRNYGPAADPFALFLGGEFIRHGKQQVATALVVSPKFPGFDKLGARLTVMEEWYTLKEFAPDLHAQLVLDTKGMEGGDYRRPPFPIAWARRYGQGRVAYNAMGHREDIWDSEAFQSMMLGAIKWAGGVVEADVTPNLQEVAPGAMTLQPVPEDVKQ